MKAVVGKITRLRATVRSHSGLVGIGARGTVRVLLAASVLLIGSGAAMAQLAPLPTGVQQQGLPPALKDIGIDQKLGTQVPKDLTFRDETGQSVRLGQYFTGKPVILTLVYYDCPMLCTQILNGLARSINVLSYDAGRDFNIVTVSFNPKETSALAAAKKELYLKSYRRPEAADGWHFLTGDEANIKALTETVGFKYAYDPASNLYAHASGIILLTPEGKISRYFYGVEYPPRDLRLGLVEASEGRIGTPVDKVLLFCYRYDPSTGKYSLLVLKIVRLAGLATVLGIGLMIMLLRRKSQKQQSPGPSPATWPLALIPLFPEEASSHAAGVDHLYIFLVALTVFFTALIFVALIYLAIRYRQRSPGEVGRKVIPNSKLEIGWIVIPFLICLVIFGWGTSLFFDLSTAPKDSVEIYVVAKQWMWKIQHQNGQREIDELHVPVGQDIKLIMSTEDVIHSFFIPAFRIKADVVPGRYCTTWFRATKPGKYHLFCAEYCGTNHSGMIGTVYVMTPEDYQAWLSRGSTEGSLASEGQQVFQQLGCSECHKENGQGRGPRLIGVFGKPVLLDNGQTVMADESYVRESIFDPKAKIVAGFQGIMPTFQGVINEEQMLQLVAYIKSLESEGQSPNSTTVPPPGGSERGGPKGYPGGQPAP